ncbi:toll/interleukin-1 receptor domain-containing protein [Clostridium tagluense]|uniref:toll/interleukin-1 receptor domain-containing protein n=1 Tax=Clostridium tagluense TaxID=360422 RepID=UPI001C0BBBE9|nr:toll/interleukin-1 receptor domain-containing protein [Clostridium tagluense]MBU3129852.1 toll/interleukin-1 receptor domain-containing protein [Clostridium tagluense]
MSKTGWNLCWDSEFEEYTSLANTPEYYSLGAEIVVNGKRVWMVSPPTSDEGVTTLVECVLKQESTYETSNYEDIFLSHNSEDKPFTRRLKEMLNDCGVKDVWIDEAEILIGDSLLQKIAEGVTDTTYFGIILSKNSIKSAW